MLKKILAASAVAVPVLAHAALPAEATAAFTSLSGNLTDILGAVWPMVATATGAFVLLKLFKRGAGKI